MKIILGSILIALLISSTPSLSQTPRIDSLLNVLPTEISDTRFDVLNLLYCEFFKYETSTAKKYIDLRQADAALLKDSLKICENFIGYGQLYNREGENEKSEEILLKAIGIAERNGFNVKLKFIYNELLILYNKIGAYDKALDYNYKSLERRKIEAGPLEVSVAYNNLGLTYENLKDYDKALELYLKSLHLKEKEKIVWDIVISLANISGIYNVRGEYETGLTYSKRAKLQCDSKCTLYSQWISNKSLGESYLFLDSLDKAETYFLQSLSIAEKNKSTNWISESLIYVARLKLRQDKTDEAIKNLNMANNLLQKSFQATSQLAVYELYIEAYRKNADYKLLANYLGKYDSLDDQIYNGLLIKNVVNVSSSVLEGNKVSTIEVQKELLTLKEKAIAQQRVITIISVVLIILLAVVALMFWHTIKTKGRINQILNKRVKERTRELNLRNDELNRFTLEQNTVLEKLNQQVRAFTVTLNGLMYVAEKDVRDPLAIGYLRKLDKEISKMKNKTSLFLKPKPTRETENAGKECSKEGVSA